MAPFSVCGGKMTDPVSVMKSPGFPDNNYPDNANCSWTIEIKNGRTISLVAETFDLQNSTDCPDYVEVCQRKIAYVAFFLYQIF